MVEKRSGVITFKGKPMTLIGPQVAVGQKAPEFTVVDSSLSPVTLASSKGKARLISVVPSLDTPVGDAQTKRFNDEAAKLGDKVEILTVSMDLPFAQKRWCGALSNVRVKTASDYKDRSFGTNYGVLIDELKLLTRSIFVVDASDTVRYVEYVKEVTEHPNYEAALAAVRKAAG